MKTVGTIIALLFLAIICLIILCMAFPFIALASMTMGKELEGY